MNSRSIAKASVMICWMRSLGTLFTKWWLCKCTAKSQCMPSSREISSFEKVKPGMRPRFFSQKMEQNAPLKKMPSTAAKAINRSAKEGEEIQRKAQSAFFLMASKVSMAWNSLSRSAGSLM